ncbi:MAG: tetratricopeptide repeat protein [Chloroflexi bacterium]|nr:tetratricopeptide repeat protein [Chloroflexota bacterium]
MGLDEFRAQVQSYRRALGFTQKQLAHELGMSPSVLSHKLHATDGLRLTQIEVKAIIKLLARWQAISTRADAVELLDLMGLKAGVFTDAEWAASPLRQLEVETVAAPVLPVPPPVAPRAALPTTLTPLIGREALLAALLAQIQDPHVRLITLTGPGGVGKTRLAQELARLSRNQFLDSVVWVSLAGIADAALVDTEIAQQLQVKANTSGTALVDRLIAVLAARATLLILDNFEQVLEAAPVIAALLQGAERLKVIVTSRAVLNLYGEHQVRVPPLELPNLQQFETPEDLVRHAAVALFVARSQTVRRDFALTDANARAVAEICIRLDGLPLALELAAARGRLFSPSALLQRLDQPLSLLDGGAVNATARQRTLRATIAWSYELLDPAEQRLFRVISAFPGGCSIEALEGIFVQPPGSSRSVVDLLTSLLDKSLVDQCELPDGALRITMLETLREFGRELLLDSREWDAVREQQADYFQRWLETTTPLLSGAAQLQAATSIEHEHDNLRAVLSWSAHAHPQLGVGLVACLSQFWNMRGLALEGLRWAELLLGDAEITLVDETAQASYAKAYNSGGALAFATGNYARAETYLQRALRLRLQLEDSEGIASTYNNLGNLAWNRSDLLSARQYFEEAVRIAESIQNTKLVASVLNNLGTLLQSLNEFALAEAYLVRALDIWRSFGNQQSIANTLSNLGGIALRHQNFAQAMLYYVESLALQEELGNKRNAGAVLANMGEVALNQGDFAQAKAYFERTLSLQRDVDYQWGVASAIGDLGRIAFYQYDYGTALARLQEALTLMRQFNDTSKIGLIVRHLGAVALKLQDVRSARAYLREALSLYQDLDDLPATASALACLAATYAVQGSPETAARLAGAAFSAWERSGLRVLPVDELHFMPELALARAALDASTYAAAYKMGAGMTVEEVLVSLA